MSSLSDKLNKKNEKLKRNILTLKDHIEYLENNNDKLALNLDNLRKQSLKSSKFETCDSLKNEHENIHKS